MVGHVELVACPAVEHVVVQLVAVVTDAKNAKRGVLMKKTVLVAVCAKRAEVCPPAASR